MEIKQNLVAPSKYSLKCPHAMIPEYITIHNTYNDAPAANEIDYMISNDKEVSFHLAVDDKEAIQGIPFDRNSWNAGDGGSGTGNRKSIAIEICYSKSGGERFDKAYENAIEVTAQLMKQFNIPASKIMYHQNWSGKYCPHRMLDGGITVEKFRELAQAKYNEMYRKVDYKMYVKIDVKDKEQAEKLINLLKNAEIVEVEVEEPKPVPAPVPTPAPAPAKPSLDEIARAVINGDYGNGHATREARLRAAGMLEHYTYEQIRKRVNELCA